MLEYLLLLADLFRALLRSRSALIAETLLLRQQLAALTRPTRQRPRLRTRDKRLWIVVRWVWRDWRRYLVVVRPETVIGWHRTGWRLVWRWASRPRGGRPRLSGEVRDLIARMARENPMWGSERIRGELRKLGIAVSKRSVQQYRRRGPARPPSQSWRTFLANHRPDIWAADLLTVQTLAFRTLYVLLFITHGRRELVHVNVTAHPTAAWVWRQLIEATPWGRQPRYLLRDRDAVYGGSFVPRARRLGIEALLSPIRAPRANAVAERVIGTLRRECLDHLVVVNERHLRAILADFVRFYNAERPHRTLGLETPVPAARPSVGRIRSRAVLGGLHHVYERAA
jgi:transposase InsO family protein